MANSKDGVFADYFHVNDADANLAKIPESISELLRVGHRSGECD
ncbi:hypothetical protein OG612_43995 (plasmid) [Streptomyces sp. NBC_01527]|nr:hypothetical protein OG763_44220 [Streptomyces sp. NBC_01230]